VDRQFPQFSCRWCGSPSLGIWQDPLSGEGFFLAINAIMWVSAIPIGGHYLVDLVAGTGLALLMTCFV
jgi:membrane-associated phospholipid phosphatase